MLLLTCLLLAIWPSASEYIGSEESKPFACPTWMYRSSANHSECVCGDSLNGVVSCNAKTSTVHLPRHFCIFFSEELDTTLIGNCPYGSGGLLPKNISKLKDDAYVGLCGHFHRKGQLCGECEDKYTLPVYSYDPGCVKCDDFENGWIKFIAAAFLPLTIFYIIAILFRISATSSALNGYVLVSQLAAISARIQVVFSGNHFHHISYNRAPLVDFIIAVYAIWNLDFFRSFYQPICLHPGITYPQVLLLDYAVAVYPLLLIFITFILVNLHDNYATLAWLWRPFHKCLVLFRKQWTIRSYLIDALATFIILSYVKILAVSFEFLTPSRVYNMENQSIKRRPFWYYDGTIEMTSKAYLPYLVLALFMLIIFNILPLLLLTLYPFSCFQKFLNCCLPSIKCKLALQIFMDTFHGCYEDTTHDYRHFAALYLAVRFFNALLSSVLNFDNTMYLLASSLFLVFMLVLVAKLQPYKCKRSNTVDIVMLLAFISGSISHCMTSAVIFPKWLNIVVTGVSAAIPPSYMLFLILTQISPQILQCCTKSKTFVLKRMNKFKINAEDQTLLNYGVTDYNTCN